ncbi:MAG: tetratricopeptide repeat protein [Kiritimatiellia bacterium]
MGWFSIQFRGVFLTIVSLALWTAAGRVHAQENLSELPEEVRVEIEYAEGLLELGLHDFAEEVLSTVKDPAAGAQLEVLRQRKNIMRGDFDKVWATIRSKPNQDSQEVWALKLALADGYYAWGKYPEAKSIYQSFFQRYPDGPPEALKRFYMNSAYKYAQMLLLIGEKKQALQGYKNVLKAGPKRHVIRQMKAEMAELLLQLGEENTGAVRQRYFQECEEICRELMWQRDLWFGKAVAYRAHIMVANGNIEEAMKLLKQNLNALYEIDQSLQQMARKEGAEDLTHLSPMAECRYLVGVMMQEEAERLLASGGDMPQVKMLLAGKPYRTADDKEAREPGALQHFVNVFYRYPQTSWAPDAGMRLRQVKELLEKKFGASIEVEATPEQMEKVRKMQFKQARTFFNQNQFDKALEAYKRALNLFPEGETSVAAAGELGRCYIDLEKPLYADMVAYYLAERFGGHPQYRVEAGNQLLRMSLMYEERKAMGKKQEITELFFRYLRRHPRTASMLFYEGEQRLAAEDYEGALEYFLQIKENEDSGPTYYKALSRIAYCYSQLEEHEKVIDILKGYVKDLEKEPRPGHALAEAKFRIARAYKEMGEKYIPVAFKRYSEIISMLEGKDKDRYAKNAEEREKNTDLLAGSQFYKAHCFALLKKPADKVKLFKAAAVKILKQMVEEFPDSNYAPAALSQLGTLYTVLDEPEKASQTLDKLQKKYPDAPESKNALYMLGRNLLELGRRKEAVEIFKEMFEGSGKYSANQILTAGQELLKAGEYEIAVDAFDRVLSMTSERAYEEPALVGKGEALYRLDRHGEAVKPLETMLEKYEKSRRGLEASFTLSGAYAAIAEKEEDSDKRFDFFNEAVKALKRVRQYTSDKGKLAETDLRVAEIDERKAAAEKQFGSEEEARKKFGRAIGAYQTLIMFGDYGNPKVRPRIEEACYKCIPLLMELEKWADALEVCNTYLDKFKTSGKYVLEVQRWRNRAKVRAVMEGQTAPEEEAEEEVVEEEMVPEETAEPEEPEEGEEQ